jgi:hypothetical protein
VEVGGISVMLKYERQNVLQQICHENNGFFSKDE